MAVGTVDDLAQEDAREAALIVVGGPTHNRGMAKPDARKALAKRGSKHGAVLPGRESLRGWLERLRNGRAAAATFDTRFDKPAWIVGSAAKGAAQRVGDKGCEVLGSQSFFVRGNGGPLAEEEREASRRLGRERPRRRRGQGVCTVKPIEHQAAGFDSLQFLDGASKRVIKSWIEREEREPIPWTPLHKPLSESRVALISSAGVALKTDRPFDEEGERRNPWWSIPATGYPARDAHRGRPSASSAHRALLRRVGPGLRHALDPARGAGGIRARSATSRPRTTPSWATCCVRRSSCAPACPRSSSASRRRPSMPYCWCRCDRSAAGPWDWPSARSRRPASRQSRSR